MPSSFSGNLVTYQSVVTSGKTLRELVKRAATCQQLHCHFVREWSFSSEMEVSPCGVSRSYEKQSLECLTSPNRAANKASEKEASVNASMFVNHAAIAWHESRRKWIGDQSQKSNTMQKDPIISWSMTYEDLLSTNEPFSEPIPLPEMVDFLVDLWHDDGLFD